MNNASEIIKSKIESFKADKVKNYKEFKAAVNSGRTLDADHHETEMMMLDRVIYEMEKLETKISTALLKSGF